MPSFSRSVTVNWSGPLREGGKGEIKAGTGAFTLPVNFPSRVGDAAGSTSPEELIAAAHGSWIDPATFPDVAKEAEGKCPVSNALRGSLAIEVNASVK